MTLPEGGDSEGTVRAVAQKFLLSLRISQFGFRHLEGQRMKKKLA